MNITAELLSSIRCHITESFVMEMLACSFAQKKFTKSLIESALGQPISEDAYIHLDDGTAVKYFKIVENTTSRETFVAFGRFP